MASVPWPDTQPGAWDQLYLVDRIFPGLCLVKVKGGQKIDRKDGPGSDGESTTQQGEKVKDVDIIHRMWTPEQWDDYQQSCFRLIEPIADKRRPVDIVTSVTAFRGITSIVIGEIEGPSWETDKRWMEFHYRCIEHKPPSKKNTTKKNEASLGSQNAFASGGSIGPNGRIIAYSEQRASVTLGFPRGGLPTT